MTYRLNQRITLERIVGNREKFAAILRDQDREPIDLTGTTIVFRMVLIADGTVKVNDQPATPDADQVANKGKVTYSPGSADVDTAGVYACYFRITSTTPAQLFPYDGAKWQLDIKSEVTP